jgi:hypothetical protein
MSTRFERLRRIERIATLTAGDSLSEIEAQELLESLTDSELEAIAAAGGDDRPIDKEATLATCVQLAECIFHNDPDLLAACRQRVRESNHSHNTQTKG